MKILAIETSCDETCAAVTQGTEILSNVVWSQVDLHKEFGGVVPSIARRAHQEKIGLVVDRAMLNAKCEMQNIDAIAVTVGPGLAIALEVGIAKAKELAIKWNKPLIAVNHIEGHVLSSIAMNSELSTINFPAMALVVSGGHTELILVEAIGKYKIIARTIDDALGEALDKAARMLGLGYPGGAELEKAARTGNPQVYPLSLPMLGRENQNEFSYSGLKTAFYRLVNTPGKKSIPDLAACFQDRAFQHLIRIIRHSIINTSPHPSPKLGEGEGGRGISQVRDLLVGGGVIANQELRKRLEKLGQEVNLKVHFAPMELTGDNAAMIGIAAGFAAQRGEFVKDLDSVDRLPRWRIDQAV